MIESSSWRPSRVGDVISDEMDALLVVPPFVHLKYPSLALHTLQACARAQGFRVEVLYANLVLAAMLGVEKYNSISHGNTEHSLAGEYIFSPFAFEKQISIDEHKAHSPTAPHRRKAFGQNRQQFEYSGQLHRVIKHWLDLLVEALANKNIQVVGCTSSFDQTAASIAVLNRLKQRYPGVITVLGGANCEGNMAQGLAGLSCSPDYIFNGEADSVFVDFLKNLNTDVLPSKKIIEGRPCTDMDKLPRPVFDEYFHQLNCFASEFIDAKEVSILYETSRGCWWGAKKHCTFCGLNGLSMQFRQKSADVVIDDLREFGQRYPTAKVFMTDNIMPFNYFKTLLPRLPEEVPEVELFYEQKSNLSLEKIILLKNAGVNVIQPGIESLSTPFLQRMKKGVTAAQNIATLRYARSTHLKLAWNLLYAFPGDQWSEYAETEKLIPLVTHLSPPVGIFRLSIDRFSPYFEQPELHGVTNIKPLNGYESAFPTGCDLENIAYHFSADYPTAADLYPELIEKIVGHVLVWQQRWQEIKNIPVFSLTQLSDVIYLLYDSRNIPGCRQTQFLDFSQAQLAVTASREIESDAVKAAVRLKWGVIQDRQYIPLATAEPSLLQSFERVAKPSNFSVRQDIFSVA